MNSEELDTLKKLLKKLFKVTDDQIVKSHAKGIIMRLLNL